jgi:T5SS/PEP-CTERM-associated repeat protein
MNEVNRSKLKTTLRALPRLMALAGAAALLAAGAARAQTVIDNATVNVPGTYASPWNVAGEAVVLNRQLHVGENGTATLNILLNGEVDNTNGYIGYGANSHGAVTVDGSNALWKNSTSLTVGNAGTGNLSVQNRGTVNAVSGYIGYVANSTGEVTIDGANSLWSNTGSLNVGYQGTGNLLVQNGGAVTSNSGLIGSSSTGMVTVDGTDSSWAITEHLTVGVYDNSHATLNITNGGHVSSNAATTALSIGNGSVPVAPNISNAVGVVNVDGVGSELNIAGPTIVARYGSGALNITNGGVVNVFAYPLVPVVGFIPFANPELAIPLAYFTEPDIGALVATYASTAAGMVMVGFEPNSTGTINVDGSGSKWTISGYLDMSYKGHGTMNITGGGVVSSGSGYIASEGDSDDIVTVAGQDKNGVPSQWKIDGILYIASLGDGTLTIRDGGIVKASTVWEDAGVLATGTGFINIGAGRTTDPAHPISPQAPGTLDTDSVSFGPGISDLVFNHTAVEADNYVFAPLILHGDYGGHADVYFENGVTALTGATGTSASPYYGTTTVHSGATMATGVAQALSGNSDYVVESAGNVDLRGYSQSVATLDNAGSINMGANPGAAPNTTLTVNGNYTGSGGTITLNTVLGDDASASDKLVVSDGTSGTTYLHIANAGGLGAQTTGDGILVVQVTGASSGAFALKGRVIAGNFEYKLFKGDANGANGNWYLRSSPKAAAMPVPALDHVALALLVALLALTALIAARCCQDA